MTEIRLLAYIPDEKTHRRGFMRVPWHLQYGDHFVIESPLTHEVSFERKGRPKGKFWCTTIHLDLQDEDVEDICMKRIIDNRKFVLKAYNHHGELHIAEVPVDVAPQDWQIKDSLC